VAISHNPVFNQSMRSGAKGLQQTEVDARFEEITSTKPMTLEGTASKVIGMLMLVVLGAAGTWVFNLEGLAFPAMFVGLGVAWGFGQHFRRSPAPWLYYLYAVVQGVFIGGISSIFESMYPGIVQSAVLGTLTTAGGMFVAYRFGWIKVNERFTKIMTFALIGYFGFAMINLGFALFGGGGIYTSQFGWIAALIGVGLAAFTLNLDFEAIKQGVAQGAPEEFEWRAAFGMTATLVWLYIEILRMLAIFNQE